MRDEDLIRDPTIRRAVEARRAVEPDQMRSHHWPIGWLLVGLATGVLLLVLIELIRMAG